MASKDKWIVWVDQNSGRKFLGLGKPSEDDRQTRFCIIGKMLGQAFNFGFWIDVERVEEWAMPENIVTGQWNVTPRMCLVPASMISYVQLISAKEQIGFSKVK